MFVLRTCRTASNSPVLYVDSLAMTFMNVSYMAFDTVYGYPSTGEVWAGRPRSWYVKRSISVLLSEITLREHTVTTDESHLYRDSHGSLPAQRLHFLQRDRCHFGML